MNPIKTPEQVALGSLPAEIMGDDVPVTDPQVSLAAAVSRATRSSRAWDKQTFKAACRAARPHIERDLRSRGRAFSRDDVRLGVRKSLHAYATQYGVRLPARSGLGKTDLEVMAGEICGAFAFPWQSFLPPQVKVAVNAAQAGSPKAASWLSKFFGGKSQVAPAPAPAAKEEAPKTASSGSDDSLGAWFHRLNPLYWVKSADERSLIDKERQAWIDNAKLQKKLGKREVVLQQGQKAVDAKQAVAAAQARSSDIEAQLKAIQSQLAGACVSGVGGEDGYAGRIARVSKKNVLSLEKGDESFIAPNSSYDAVVGRGTTDGYDGKIAQVTKEGLMSLDKGDEVFLSPDSSYDAVVGEKKNPFAEDVPAVDAAPVLSKVARARELNAANAADLGPLAAKLKANLPLSPDETSKVLIYLARNEQLHEFRKHLVAGDSLSGNPSKNKISRHVVLGAVKALTPSEQQAVARMTSMAKAGNPNAQRALALLRSQGYAVTPPPPSTSMGSFINDVWNVATKPITVPAKYLWKGTKWVARKTGITKGSTSPEQSRLARLRAASKRRQAAAARARAADAQSEAEYRVQQQLADAAQAEADAADAEATAKEAALMTAEAEHTPVEGDSSGASGPVITPLPPTPPLPSAETFKAARRKVVARKNPRAAKILAASETQTPAGVKLKASMALYKGALKPKSKERKAVEAMVAKAKKGDKQAISDVNALKAAGLAVKAEKSAGRRVAVALAYKATVAKAKATKARAEVALGDKLARASRTRELNKVAKIERRAAAGDKKCLTFVKTHVAKAKAGDPRSKKVVDAVKLVRAERLAAPTRSERRNLAQGRKLVKRASRGDRSALAQIRVIEAAAAHGNPNAVRAKKRLQTAAARELTLKTGVIVVPGITITASRAKKKAEKARGQVAKTEQKIAAGKATREETMAASKLAADTGDRVKAGELAAQAAALPSAKDSLQKVAPVLAAASAGNPVAAEAIERAGQQAARGELRGMETMGKVAAVKAMNDVSLGRAVEPEMQAAARDVVAAQAGNKAATEKIVAMQKQAQEGVPEAVKYVVYASGAAAVGRALAASPQAKLEWQQKVGIAPPDTSREDVQVVASRAPAPSMLASTALAVTTAEPDAPLPPIRDFLGMLGAAVRALTLTTRHPFQNHREGLVALANKRAPDESSGEAASIPQELVPTTDENAILNRIALSRMFSSNPMMKQRHAELIKTIQSRASQGDEQAKRLLMFMKTRKSAPVKIIRQTLLERAEAGDSSARQELVELDRLVVPEKKVDTSLLGDDPHVETSPAFKASVNRLREKLSEARERAAGGHAPSVKMLQKAKEDFVASSALATQKNDADAMLRVKIYRATGLFGKS